MSAAQRCRAYGHDRFYGVLATLRADTVRYLHRSPEASSGGDDFKHRLSAFATPQLFAVALHRFAHYFEVNGWRRVAAFLTRVNSFVHRTTISARSCIGPGFMLPHPPGVTFAGSAGRDLTLYALCVCCSAEPMADPPLEQAPRLGDSVSLGGHASVVGAVSIGDRVSIANNAQVDTDVDANTIVFSRAVRVRLTPTVQAERLEVAR